MFMDKTKSKFAIIQIRKSKLFNSNVVTEVIYDKRTKEKVKSNMVAVYLGDPQTEVTWNYYQLMLDVDGKDPDVEYFTKEQYVSCWDSSELCDVELDFFFPESFKKYIIYEQDHYGHRPRKVKKPENRYLEKNLPKIKDPNYFPKSMELLKESWAKRRKEILENANNDSNKE